ncbi:transcription elongation factor SPT4 homolog 2-like [Argentina anserina]|uniref:transcription elongation factor SPT4 homolog 2-like n=1 Tax=Argentina anserina TaxID=57926 RepID=UPI002176685B|nr:transcription elongation factor SPT4 homolog 2-like [Potentilla anserina]
MRNAAQTAQIPTSFCNDLRACLRCRLVKTYDQFRENGCENCPFFKMEEDSDLVNEGTTPNFSWIISVMDPDGSWAAKWLRISRFVPGCYTLAVSEDLHNICEDECVQYVPPETRMSLPNDQITARHFWKQVSLLWKHLVVAGDSSVVMKNS